MKILYVTDVHAQEDSLDNIASSVGANIILDGGDHNVTSIKRMYSGIPRYFIYGNHEPEEITQIAAQNREYGFGNLRYLRSGKITKIEDESGIRVNIGVIAGHYGKETWENEKLAKQFPLRLTKKKCDDFMQQQGNLDILLTHEPSTHVSFGNKIDAGVEAFTPILDKFQPLFHLSGHMHRYATAAYGRTTLIAGAEPHMSVGLIEVIGSKISYTHLQNHVDYYAKTPTDLRKVLD